MENSIYIGLSLQTALRRQLDVVANNVANIDTTAYKARSVMFEEFINQPSGQTPDLAEPVSMVNDYSTYRDDRPGKLEATGNSLDIALEGNGYFAVESPYGMRFTRAGSLQVNNDRQLVDRNGLPVLGENQEPITLPEDDGEIVIDKNGYVTVGDEEVGKLYLAAFEKPQFLKEAAGGLYISTEQPVAAQNVTVQQGYIETSNVNPIMEMSRMVEIQRQYQSVQNLLTQEHDRLRSTISTLGQLSGSA